MNLFNTNKPRNLLPKDGVVHYHGKIMNDQKANYYLNHLQQNIEWKNDEVFIFGKHIVTKRKVAWYAEALVPYSYSNTTKAALPWTPELLNLKNQVEKITNVVYNSCLLNLYHSGEEGMSWHSDDEKSIVGDSAIASLSFGANRKFSLKHKKTKESLSVILESGSLLVMQGTTQQNWLHAMPKTKKVKLPRVNLTFRQMILKDVSNHSK